VLTDVLVSRSRAHFARASSASPAALEQALRAAALEGLGEVGAPDADATVELEAFLELHYVAQTHELLVPAAVRVRPSGFAAGEPLDFDAACLAETLARFHAEHERLYTFAKPHEDVEILGVRVDVRQVRPKPALSFDAPERRAGPPEPTETRMVRFEAPHGAVATPVYAGDDLEPGEQLAGPLVIQERDTTVVVYPGDAVTVLDDRSYELEVGRDEPRAKVGS
jgi:N-methylhydantoinase A